MVSMACGGASVSRAAAGKGRRDCAGLMAQTEDGNLMSGLNEPERIWNPTEIPHRPAAATCGGTPSSTQQAKVGAPQSVNLWRDVNAPMTARPTLCRNVRRNTGSDHIIGGRERQRKCKYNYQKENSSASLQTLRGTTRIMRPSVSDSMTLPDGKASIRRAEL